MPDFLLTDPGGQRFKLTVPEGVSEQDIHAFIAGQELPGEPQPRSRGDILEEGAGQLKEALAPSYLKDTPPTHESDIALASPAGKPRKIGPPSGPPTAAQIAGGLGADIAAAALPEMGAVKLAMPALGLAPRQIRSHLDELTAQFRAGRITAEQLGEARARLGLPRESSISSVAIGSRPITERTLSELRGAPRQSPMDVYDRALREGRITDQEHEGFAQALGVSRPVPRVVDRFSARPPPAPQPFSPLGHYGQEFYNEHIAPHFPDQQAFVRSYFNGAYNGRFNVEMTRDGHLQMNGPLVLDGKTFGEIDRIIDPDGKTAHHDYLRVDDTKRGGGFVKQMTANQINLYRKMGIERVEMYANIPDGSGGYAWAKYGWLPDKWPELAWSLETRLRLLARSGLDPAMVTDLRALLNSPDPQAIWVISDFGDPWQHPQWEPQINTVGKAMLAGSGWNGTLRLNDTAQMTRFDRYVSQGK